MLIVMIDPSELDEAGRHRHYLVQGQSNIAEQTYLHENRSVKRSRSIAPFSQFVRPNVRIWLAGCINRSAEVDFDAEYLIVLHAIHAFTKNFRRLSHVKNRHQSIDYLRAKVKKNLTPSLI